MERGSGLDFFFLFLALLVVLDGGVLQANDEQRGHDVAIAEGVSTSSSSSFRWFSSHSGLDECVVSIESSGQLQTVVLDGSTRSTSVTILDALGAPALAAATDIEGGRKQYSITPAGQQALQEQDDALQQLLVRLAHGKDRKDRQRAPQLRVIQNHGGTCAGLPSQVQTVKSARRMTQPRIA